MKHTAAKREDEKRRARPPRHIGVEGAGDKHAGPSYERREVKK